MGLQVSLKGFALPDVPGPASTFVTGGTDQLEVTSFNADCRIEVQLPDERWHHNPYRVMRGLHRSISGMKIAYPPRGVIAFRLSNWLPGATASVDLEASSVG